MTRIVVAARLPLAGPVTRTLPNVGACAGGPGDLGGTAATHRAGDQMTRTLLAVWPPLAGQVTMTRILPAALPPLAGSVTG